MMSTINDSEANVGLNEVADKIGRIIGDELGKVGVQFALTLVEPKQGESAHLVCVGTMTEAHLVLALSHVIQTTAEKLIQKGAGENA